MPSSAYLQEVATYFHLNNLPHLDVKGIMKFGHGCKRPGWNDMAGMLEMARIGQLECLKRFRADCTADA